MMLFSGMLLVVMFFVMAIRARTLDACGTFRIRARNVVASVIFKSKSPRPDEPVVAKRKSVA